MEERSICLFLALKRLSAQAVHNELTIIFGPDEIAYSIVTSHLRQRQIDALLLLLVSDLGWYVDTDLQMPAPPITPGADALSVSFGKRRSSAPIVRQGLEDQASGTCGNIWC
jgi:hypothetical protein